MSIKKQKSTTNLPPNQVITEKFPEFTYGELPKISINDWILKICGTIDTEINLNWDQLLKQFKNNSIISDFHCVTKWSKLNILWEGILIKDLISFVKPSPSTKYVIFSCFGNYSTNLTLDTLITNNAILAHSANKKPLNLKHGWPLRLVVPNRYGWKSAKWIKQIKFSAIDEPGLWEKNGYHNNGNPWAEERFWPEL